MASTVTLKSGDTIWGLVQKKLGPGASNADIAAATNKVLKANGETAASAKTMQVGEKVDMSALDPKKPAANKPADKPATNTTGGTEAPAATDPAAGTTETNVNPATDNALGEAEKREQERLEKIGLGALPPGLQQLLDQVYKTSDPSVSPFLGALTFSPQDMVAAATPNGAVNTPGNTPGKGPGFNGLNAFLAAQGALNPKKTQQLAFNTGSFVNQISGIQFTSFDPAKILAQFPGLVA